MAKEKEERLRSTGNSSAGTVILSVIVPAFHAEAHIARCLKSIAAQTLDGIECIVVDDGSTDHTARIAEEIFSSCPRVAWKLIRQENRGASQARYAGVRAAGGAWIGFADADDYVEPGYFEALYRCAGESGADLVASDFTQEGVQKRQTNKGRAYRNGEVITPEEARLAIFDRTGVYSFPWNKLFRKKLLAADGFPEGSMNGEDLVMVLSALTRASSVALCKEAGYHYVTRYGSQTLQPYSQTKQNGYENYRRIYSGFAGTEAERRALARHIMLEYLSCMLLMYRSKTHDSGVEQGVLSFVRRHRKDYILHGRDGMAAKCFAAFLNPVTHRLFFALWRRALLAPARQRVVK